MRKKVICLLASLGVGAFLLSACSFFGQSSNASVPSFSVNSEVGSESEDEIKERIRLDFYSSDRQNVIYSSFFYDNVFTFSSDLYKGTAPVFHDNRYDASFKYWGSTRYMLQRIPEGYSIDLSEYFPISSSERGMSVIIHDQYFDVSYSENTQYREYVFEVIACFNVSHQYNKVTFLDKDGAVIGVDYVPKYRYNVDEENPNAMKANFPGALKPYIDEDGNYWEFSSWDKDLNNITEDTTLSPIYKINEEIKMEEASVPQQGQHSPIETKLFSFDYPIVGLLDKKDFSQEKNINLLRFGKSTKEVTLISKTPTLIDVIDCVNGFRLQSGQKLYVFLNTKYDLSDSYVSDLTDTLYYKAENKDEVILLNNEIRYLDSSTGGYKHHTYTKANVKILAGNELIVPEGITSLTLYINAWPNNAEHFDLCGKIQLPTSLKGFELVCLEDGYGYSYESDRVDFPFEYFNYFRGCGYLGNVSNPYLFAVSGTTDYICPGTIMVLCTLGSNDLSFVDEVIIPESVISIGASGRSLGKLQYECPENIYDFGFQGEIEELEFPNKNVFIDDRIILYEVSTIKVIIPSDANVNSIFTHYASFNCIEIKETGSKIMQMVDGFLVNTTTKTLVFCPASRNENTIRINGNIHHIAPNAFDDYFVNIQRIFVPECIESIAYQEYTDANFFCCGENLLVDNTLANNVFKANSDGTLTQVGDFYFAYKKGGAYLVEYVGPRKRANIKIPSTVLIDGLETPVVGIRAKSLQDIEIDSLDIPEGIKDISLDSFDYCTFSCDIVLPTTLPFIQGFKNIKSTKQIKFVSNLICGYEIDFSEGDVDVASYGYIFPMHDENELDAEFHIRTLSTDYALSLFCGTEGRENRFYIPNYVNSFYFDVGDEIIRSSDVTSWTTNKVVCYSDYYELCQNIKLINSLIENKDLINDYELAKCVFLSYFKDEMKNDFGVDLKYNFASYELLNYYLFEATINGETLFTKVDANTVEINDKFWRRLSSLEQEQISNIEIYVSDTLVTYKVLHPEYTNL